MALFSPIRSNQCGFCCCCGRCMMYVSVLIFYTDKYRTAFFLLASYKLLYNGALFSTTFCSVFCVLLLAFCYMYQLLYSPRAIILKYYSTVSVIELIIKNGIRFFSVVFVVVIVSLSISIPYLFSRFVSCHVKDTPFVMRTSLRLCVKWAKFWRK